jgi:hypothetical protein
MPAALKNNGSNFPDEFTLRYFPARGHCNDPEVCIKRQASNRADPFGPEWAAHRGNFAAGFKFPTWPETDPSTRSYPSMRRAQPVSIRSQGWVASIAVLGLLTALSNAPAQDAGVSGIPPGPANARGLNGSISNPSGSGNAPTVPPLPQPHITPVVPPGAAPPIAYRASPGQRAVRTRPTRFAARTRLRGRAARAAVREQDRLLDRQLTTICRGC